MEVRPEFGADAAAILARRHDNGADYWATPDLGLIKGGPFSTLGAARLLVEFGVEATDPVLASTTELIWSAWRDDGRFAVAPQQFGDNGWRCNKFSYGHGPETEYSNPGPTLIALDAFRFTGMANNCSALDGAVAFLLDHWVSRAPLGPCHYGIGSLFLQVSYPLADYHPFSWVQVLSHYERSRADSRFAEAVAVLEAQLVDGQVVPSRVSRAFAGFQFCRKGEPSQLATLRYAELQARLTSGLADPGQH